METLRLVVADLMKMNSDILSKEKEKVPYHLLISKLHALMFAIESCEKDFDKKEILGELHALREIHAKSPFIRRLQEWPLGYAGDFETIEYLCQSKNKCKPDTFEYYLEDYALHSFIAQQHRNKVAIQSSAVLDVIMNKSGAQVLVVGCGSGIDIRSIQNFISGQEYQLVLNDMDANAIAFTKSKLNTDVLSKTEFVEKNIISYVKEISQSERKFDLILFGGVFDYLTDKQIMFVLSNVYKTNLKKNGKIIFTNIKRNNPFRVWIEYLADWKLIERSQMKNTELCVDSVIPVDHISQYCDHTGLTNIVEVRGGKGYIR